MFPNPFYSRGLTAALAMLCCASSAAALRADTLLRWKFQQGQRLHVTVVQATKLVTTAGPKPREMKADTTMEMDLAVDSVADDGTAQMTQSITRVKMRMETLGAAPIEFDTASDQQPTGAARYFAAAARLVGLEYRVTMTARGEITSVMLSEEGQKLLDEALAGASLPALFSSEGLTQTLKQSATTLPEEPVNPGDTWETSSSSKLAIGAVKQQTTYTFAGSREHDGRMLDAIDLESKLQLTPPKDAEHPAEIKEQQHTGTLWFDAEAGRFVESKVSQKLVTESPYRGAQVRVSADTTLTTTYRTAE
jgi:hypothetical protein